MLLSGVVGSTAYGLATPESDIDRLGVFAAPTETLHGLTEPRQSWVTTGPDTTYHEAAKFCRLALSSNPTAIELLWLPDMLYETCSSLGETLVGIRDAFPCAMRVRDAYLGFASQQAHRIGQRGQDPRKVAKHARHLMRLCEQGFGLYASGRLQVHVADPAAVMAFGERVADGDTAAVTGLVSRYRDLFDGVSSALRDSPTVDVVERWLHHVRRYYYV